MRLITLQEEEFIEAEEMEPEPKPPEPEFLPELPDLKPPEIELEEIAPPQTAYDAVNGGYSGDVLLPSLTGMGMKGVVPISTRNFARRSATAPLPGLPTHGPPRTRFNSNEVDQQPKGVATTQPMYPYRAKRLGIEGMVRIRFLVNRAGSTDLFKILQSEPAGEFDKVVEKTIKRWKFKPAKREGQVVETWMETTIEFKLR